MKSQCRKRNPRPSGHPSPISKHNRVDIADNASTTIETDGNKYNTFLKLLSGENAVPRDRNRIRLGSMMILPRSIIDGKIGLSLQ